MVLYCCAYGCKERFVKGGKFTFHCFPKDPERRRLWKLNLRRKDFEVNDHTKICSKHFTDDCFDTAKFGGTHLKKDAVPTIFNFPQHIQKLSCTRKPPQKHLKYSEKSTPVDCQNDDKTIFLGMENGLSADPQKRQKRLYYLGDFDATDVISPSNAQKMIELSHAQVSNLKQTIKNLSRKNKRLKERIASLTDIVSELHGAGLISDEATKILKKHILPLTV